MKNTLEVLKAGNERFVASNVKRREVKPEQLADGQNPHTIILTCADSRVPPELIFDQDLGDLFVIRVAGNSCTPEGVGSIEYAVANLGTKNIVVMGHSSCGAVSAAVDVIQNKTTLPTPALEKTIAPILPAVLQAAKNENETENILDSAIKAHTEKTCQGLLEESSLLRKKVDAGELNIYSAVYNISTGIVEISR